jgi:hypothetical protein
MHAYFGTPGHFCLPLVFGVIEDQPGDRQLIKSTDS